MHNIFSSHKRIPKQSSTWRAIITNQKIAQFLGWIILHKILRLHFYSCSIKINPNRLNTWSSSTITSISSRWVWASSNCFQNWADYNWREIGKRCTWIYSYCADASHRFVVVLNISSCQIPETCIFNWNPRNVSSQFSLFISSKVNVWTSAHRVIISRKHVVWNLRASKQSRNK